MMFVSRCILAIAITRFLSTAYASRGEQEASLDLEEHAENSAKCGSRTCTFRENASCSCLDLNSTADTEVIDHRLRDVLVSVLQVLRKATDKLDDKANIFKKMWQGSRISRAQKDLLFLEQGLKHRPELETLMQMPIRILRENGSFPVPAAAMPIKVEIWDEAGSTLIPDKHVGEIGVPLTTKTYENQRLQPNPSHNTMSGHEAKVTFRTEVTKSPQGPCSTGSIPFCINVSVKVKCISATGLPKTFLNNVPDTYCKVRLKRDISLPSQKMESGKAWNQAEPRYDGLMDFDTLEMPVIDPIPLDGTEPAQEDFTPLTPDEVSFNELLHQEFVQLGSVFLDRSKCKEARLKHICNAFAKLAAMVVDAEAIQAAAKDAGDQDAIEASADVKDACPEAGCGASLLEVSAELATGSPEVSAELATGSPAAIMGKRRSQREDGGVSGGNGKSGKKGGGDVGVVGQIIGPLLVMLVMLFLL